MDICEGYAVTHAEAQGKIICVIHLVSLASWPDYFMISLWARLGISRAVQISLVAMVDIVTESKH
jgi:hypothetical protein